MVCPRCASIYEAQDNYCRGCGLPLAHGRLPILREARLPALPPRPIRASAVGAAGALVMGVLVGLLRRRAVRRTAGALALAAVPRASGLVRGQPAPPANGHASNDDDAGTIHEVVQVLLYRRFRGPERKPTNVAGDRLD